MRETSHRTLLRVTTADTSSNGLSFRPEEPEAGTGRKDMRVATFPVFFSSSSSYFSVLFILICFFSSFSSTSSPPTFYFYIYGLFSFGTSNLNRVIRTASKSEYCDSTLILRKCQMQRYSSFVTFEPLPMELFRNFYCSIATLGQHLRFRLCFIY